MYLFCKRVISVVLVIDDRDMISDTYRWNIPEPVFVNPMISLFAWNREQPITTEVIQFSFIFFRFRSIKKGNYPPFSNFFICSFTIIPSQPLIMSNDVQVWKSNVPVGVKHSKMFFVSLGYQPTETGHCPEANLSKSNSNSFRHR